MYQDTAANEGGGGGITFVAMGQGFVRFLRRMAAPLVQGTRVLRSGSSPGDQQNWSLGPSWSRQRSIAQGIDRELEERNGCFGRPM